MILSICMHMIQTHVIRGRSNINIFSKQTFTYFDNIIICNQISIKQIPPHDFILRITTTNYDNLLRKLWVRLSSTTRILSMGRFDKKARKQLLFFFIYIDIIYNIKFNFQSELLCRIKILCTIFDQIDKYFVPIIPCAKRGGLDSTYILLVEFKYRYKFNYFAYRSI